MTLPTSGTITMQNFNTELGLASTANNSMSFIYSQAKTGQQFYNFAAYYGKAYYQQNTAGNCNNGFCGGVPVGNCGNLQCTQCTQCNTVNCANCDSQSYLQSNCNCACTYNCALNGQAFYNCQCACGGRC